QKCFQNNNNNISGHVLSLDQFLKHCQRLDHCQKVLKLELKQSDICFRKPCDSFARITYKHSFVNFPKHELVIDNSPAFIHVLKEPRKLHEPKLHHSVTRFAIVRSASISEFKLDCLHSETESKRVGLLFDDILVYNTFFDRHLLLLKLEIIGSGCVVLWLVNILVYNTFFDMITHLIFTKQAEKSTGNQEGHRNRSELLQEKHSIIASKEPTGFNFAKANIVSVSSV